MRDAPACQTECEHVTFMERMRWSAYRDRRHPRECREIQLRITKPRVFEWMCVTGTLANRGNNRFEPHDVVEMRVREEDRLYGDPMRSDRREKRRGIITRVDDPSWSVGFIVDPKQPRVRLPCSEWESLDAKLCHGENIAATLATMLKRRVEEVKPVEVTMAGAQRVSMRLMVGRADGAPTFAMRHYTVAPGGVTPRHQHNYEHEVIITGGHARVEYDGEFHECTTGDILLIAPNRMHQFVNSSQSDLTFICLVPVTFDCGTPTPGS